MSVDGVLFNKDKMKIIRYPTGKTETSYTIPDSVTNIDYSALLGCSKLQAIDFGGSEEQWKSIKGSDQIKFTVNFGA